MFYPLELLPAKNCPHWRHFVGDGECNGLRTRRKGPG